MNWNNHSKLEGQHAFLSASKYHWINYDIDKLIDTYKNFRAKERGTRLHAFAHDCIELGQRLPKSKQTLNMFVNDAIGFGMDSEVVLYYSDNCFGTADAISFKKKMLRIHDLKTGEVTAHMEQLLVYAALFCLEYHYRPEEIDIELRIYQSDEIIVDAPDPKDISDIMETIIEFDKEINELNSGVRYD